MTVNVLSYGADPTGVNDSTSAFVNALAALPHVGGSSFLPTGGGTVYAPTGHYKISSTLNFTQLQNLQGDGRYLTHLIYTGTGPCISATNTNIPTGWPSPCDFEGFAIDGSVAGTGAIGLQIGNLFNSTGTDLSIQNFTTAGAIGLYFKNYGSIPVADKMRWSGVGLYINTNAVVFDGNCTPGAGSFSYAEYEFEVISETNQNVVTMKNNALIGRSRFSVVGSCATTSASNSGWVLGMDVGAPSNRSQFTDCEFLIGIEMDGGPGWLGHRSLRLESTNLGGITGHGEMAFIDTYPAQSFQGASIAVGSIFGVSGYITDPVLGKMSFNDCSNFQGGTQRNAYILGGANIVSPFTIVPQYADVQEYVLPNTPVTITGFLNAPYTTSRSMELLFHQPASGATCVVTWPSNVKWAGGKHTLSTVNGAVDKVRLDYFPYSNTWFAELLTSYS